VYQLDHGHVRLDAEEAQGFIGMAPVVARRVGAASVAAGDRRAQLGIVGLVGGLRQAGQATCQQGGGQDQSFHGVVSRVGGSGACRAAGQSSATHCLSSSQ